MNGLNVKEVMDQIHISEEMQEEIIMNIENRMKDEKKRTKNLRKIVVGAAAFVVMAGIVSVPVQAVVKNIVKARMESIPKAEVQVIADTIQGQKVSADGFSREYSEEERVRMEELRQSYQEGVFPEKTILQVDNADEVTEDTLCYIKATGEFYLPDRELTDEEFLEIIDFNYTMSYAIEQNQEVQDIRAEMEAERKQLKEKVEAAEGISQEKAIEIAEKQMKSEIGARAEEKELMTDVYGCGAQLITDEEHGGAVTYHVGFGNPNDHSTYLCVIDAFDGSVLSTMEYIPEK